MISIVIPTHNRHEDLLRALKSIYTQSAYPEEIIVVDDGSLIPVSEKIFDDAPVIIETALIRNDMPKGPASTRNVGILAAKETWIVFLDDDDIFYPDKIEKIKSVISKRGNYLDVIYHPAKVSLVNEGVQYNTRPRNFFDMEDVFHSLLIKNEIGGICMLTIRKETLLNIGLFDEKIPALEDYELYLRLAKKRINFFYLDATLTECCIYTGRKSIDKNLLNHFMALEYIKLKYAADYKNLRKKEQRQSNKFLLKRTAFLCLLNGCKKRASIYYFKTFLLSFNPIELICAFLVLISPKIIFKLRSVK
jgi:glycosyltransferase involved in cell wall biosynthesis